jgi:hypothetical protein
MQNDEIRNAVRAVIGSAAPGAELGALRPDRPLRELISMDGLNMLAALQERLAIAIPEHDNGRLDTLDAIVAHVAADRRARPAADAAREGDFIPALSDEACYRRFMATFGEMPASQLRTLTNVDQRRPMAPPKRSPGVSRRSSASRDGSSGRPSSALRHGAAERPIRSSHIASSTPRLRESASRRSTSSRSATWATHAPRCRS